MESALLGHVLTIKGDLEHVRGVAEATLEQAKRTNGRVSELEAWRDAHREAIKLTAAERKGATVAHAEHAEKHRRRRAMFTGTVSWAVDNWQPLAWAVGGLGLMVASRWFA